MYTLVSIITKYKAMFPNPRLDVIQWQPPLPCLCYYMQCGLYCQSHEVEYQAIFANLTCCNSSSPPLHVLCVVNCNGLYYQCNRSSPVLVRAHWVVLELHLPMLLCVVNHTVGCILSHELIVAKQCFPIFLLTQCNGHSPPLPVLYTMLANLQRQ